MFAATASDVGEVVIWVGAVVAAAGVIARSQPARWLWRRNVREPFTAWFRVEVGEVVDEKLDARPLTNGWGAEALGAVAQQLGADVPPPRDPPTDTDEGR